MPGKKPLAAPADVVYLYDGSFDGFLCCVFESVYAHEIPAAIYPEQEAQPSLFLERSIPTEPAKAQRVRASIPVKISAAALEMLQKVFMSCTADKELAMLRFLLLGYREGGKVMQMLGHPDVAPVLAAEKHLGGECHLLLGFIRFADDEGVLAATITPKNFVLPFIEKHFVERYSCEDFLIFDKTHRAALVYQNQKAEIIPLDAIDFPKADETEKGYQALWKQFYNTIAIKARVNPKCLRTPMPRSYGQNNVEKLEFI